MFTLTKEGITAVVRTLMGYLYGFLLTEFALDLPDEVEGAVTVLAGTLIYIGIRELAKRFPLAEYLLIINTTPTYEGPAEQVDVAA